MKLKWTLEKFIEKARKIHGNKYDYSKSNYINYHNNIEIKCPIHGIFIQSVQNHISNGYGCRRCSGRLVFNTNDFICTSKNIHNDKYDYSKSNYAGNRKKIEIICKIHGPFFQIANSHLRGGGCSLCGKIKSDSLQHRITIDDFISRANSVHELKYDYSQVKYKNTHTKIKIICPKHGEFLQTPHNHLIKKQRCPFCSKNRVSKPETEFLNYLNIPTDRHHRQKYIKKFKVDGYNKNFNTIYEFLGDYYHGNPTIYKSHEYNNSCKKTFGKLYQDTFNRFNILKKEGYTLKYIWESDWKKFKDGIDNIPKILTYI